MKCVCFGCGHEFRPGDERLRFSMHEFEQYQGLSETPGIDMQIGLCTDCIQPGDFKTPEIVA